LSKQASNTIEQASKQLSKQASKASKQLSNQASKQYIPMNGLQPLRKPSLEALKQMNNPWNLGFSLGCSTNSLHVTMHLLPGFVCKIASR
jgi:hypothetical protein